MSYTVINLKDIIAFMGETKTNTIMSTFECPLNKDVEYFLRTKAIEFSKQDIAKTFVVMRSYKNENVIVGYFSLANKTTKLRNNVFSGKKKKRFLRFAEYSEDNKCYSISLPLIGQLGKNYRNNYNELISGDILLKLACDKVKEAQEILGGRFVYLECEDKPQLEEFYKSNGFVRFGKRNLEGDECERNSGGYLLQMLCDLTDHST